MASEWIVPTERGKVRVMLDTIPTDLGERNKLIEQRIASGQFTPVQPSMLEQAADTVSGLIPSASTMAGIGIGAMQGAAMGAPAGPVGAIGGGLIGGMVGGAGGAAVGQGLEAGGRAMTGQEQRSPMDMLSSIAGGAQAGLESHPLVSVPMGAYNIASGQAPIAGMLQLGGGLLGMPGVARQMAPTAATGSVAALSPGEAGIRAAQRLRMEMTMGESTDNAFLRYLEGNVAKTPTGAGAFRGIAAQQTGKAVEEARNVAGPMLDEATRNNRFLQLLTQRVEASKRQGEMLFDRYLRMARPESTVDITPLRDVASEITEKLGQQPIPALRNGKLDAVLEQIQGLGAQPAPKNVTTGILGPDGRPILQTIQPPAEPVTLANVRALRTAIGEIAYPSRLEGAPIADIPVAQARRLYGALTGIIEQDAMTKGPDVVAALQAANQHVAMQHGAGASGITNKFYANLLASDKQLSQMTTRLFNPRDTTLLADAKAVVSEPGWKMIQQQYFDSLFTSPVTGAVRDNGAAFLGPQFVKRIQQDGKVIETLFGPETRAALQEFAAAVRHVSPTMMGVREGELLRGGLLTSGVFGAATGQFARMLGAEGGVAGGIGTAGAFAVPWVLGQIMTNPTSVRFLTQAIRSGKSWAPLVPALARTGGSVQVNIPPEMKQ